MIKMIPINKPTIVRKDLEYVLSCLVTEKLEEGELTQEFEKKIAAKVGTKYSIAVNSFTSGLHLALLGLGIGKDDEIIIPAYADASILNALNYVGAIPVPVDVEMDSYNIDFKQAQKRVSSKTKAIILTHNFGIPADIEQFLTIDVTVIEDCSYAFGAEYHSELKKENKNVGSFGLVSIFSFDTDCIITTGNGGMILSNSRDLMSKIKKLKYNPSRKLQEYNISFDYRMADISSALGLSQLKIIDKFIERRRELANFYDNKFMKSKYKIYREITNRKNVYGKYTILVEGNIERIIDYCRRHKIIVKRPIEFPIYRALGKSPEEFPNSEHLYRKLLQIPIYPALKKKEVEIIANTLLKVL